MSPALWFGLAGAALVAGIAVVLDKAGAAVGAVSHVVGGRGWVETDPRALALSAGVSDNVYALASMMQSEAGENALLQIATGWAARNEATSRGVSVFKLLTRAGARDKTSKQFVPHESNGFYGPQNVGPRYASTRKAPGSLALQNAADVLSGSIDDPTDGATQFDAPGAQDSFLGKVAGYFSSAADVASSRSKNSDLVMVPGITSTRFWRPKA